MTDLVPNSPSWSAGDGYQVVPIQAYTLQNDYYGGNGGDTGNSSGNSSSTFNMLQNAADTSGNYYNPTNNTLATTMQGAGLASGGTVGAVAGGIGTIVGDYNNASTDTGSSVLSGAASGAAAGAAFGPWGAVIGGVVGGLAGLFGSKAKKKQANENYNASIQQATAGLQQQQANYLQNQKLTQAAISPYASAYQPNGYQFNNNLLGNGPKSALPQPQIGQLNIPNQPAQVTGNGIGKPLTANIPGATFTPGATPFQAPSTTFQPQQPTPLAAPKYTGNQATDQTNANQYLQGYAQNIALQNQLSAAAAMNPYQSYFSTPGV